MPQTQSHIVVGNSVRYLAQSGRRAGLSIVSVDAFADMDTQEAVERFRIADCPSPRALKACMRGTDPRETHSWSYGAGFENDPDALSDIARLKRKPAGNTADVLRLLGDPERYFHLLRELGISFPEITSTAHGHLDYWLFKASRRQGGLQVWLAEQVPSGVHGYFQKRMTGDLCSLLFAADGRDIQVLGFNQLEARDEKRGDFRFSRLVSGYVPPEQNTVQMCNAAERLTRALGLRGINGLDFVLCEGQAYLLDVNARPPASLELYEHVLPDGGLVTHLSACEGRLPKPLTELPRQGLEVLYARRDSRIGNVAWPEWLRDRPMPGTRIAGGSPLCTVHATAQTADGIRARLKRRADAAYLLIETFSEVAA